MVDKELEKLVKEEGNLIDKEMEISEEMLEKYQGPQDYEVPDFESPVEEENVSLTERLKGFALKDLTDKIPKISFTSNKKRVIATFLIIYAVFGVALVYLMFFNSGLKIVQEVDEKGVNVVYVENESSHIIKNIALSYYDAKGEKVTFTQFLTLKPNNRANLNVPKIQMPRFQLIAEAPFHILVNQAVAGSEVKTATDLKTSIFASKIGFVGLIYEAKLNVCNEGITDLDKVEIIEKHDRTYFNEVPRSDTINISKGACKEIDYFFTPEKTGKTKIYFNIIAANSAESQEIDVLIQE